MARPNAIPGYEAAVAKERAARNSVYLGTPVILCGCSVCDITPRGLAELTAIRSPFIFGGELNPQDATPYVQFLLCVTPRQERTQAKPEIMAAALLSELTQWGAEIDAFVATTFLDSPSGSYSDDAPIASAMAWLEYRMSCEPFRWGFEQFLDVPLRRIYQLIRCWQKEHGEPVINSLSGKCESDWLDVVNKGLADGSITPAMLQEMQSREVYRRAGKEYPKVDLIPKAAPVENEAQPIAEEAPHVASADVHSAEAQE